MDKEIYGPDQHLVEWHRDRQSNETDGFQVKRTGDRDVRCTMLFMINHDPPKCKLEPRLARLLALHTGTRPQVLYGLWQYIRTHRLQDPQERDVINLDPYLKQIFGANQIKFTEIPARLNPLLQSPDPIIIHHRIRCDPVDPKRQAMYDLDVEIDDISNPNFRNFLTSTNHSEDLSKLDHQVFEIIDQLKQVRNKHEFFDEFSNNPQQFIDKWLTSQSVDLKCIQGEPSKPSDEERKASFYKEDWMDEAVSRFFYNRVNESRLELEQVLYQQNQRNNK